MNDALFLQEKLGFMIRDSRIRRVSVGVMGSLWLRCEIKVGVGAGVTIAYRGSELATRFSDIQYF